MTYRKEIDGLRAIAVIAVVIYHSQISLFSEQLLAGGFLGVDVFFVISGYLISLLIFEQLSANCFSWRSFYSRRIRRILPALFTVMLVSLPFAYFILLPKSLIEFARSALASLLFSSNLWFWSEDSYTADISFLKPLLHTWSLSVEEQFYVFFPALALLCHRLFKKQLFSLLLAGFVASFICAIYLSNHEPSAGFFFIISRAWELAAGSLLAYGQCHDPRTHSALSERFLPLAGLLLIGASLVLVTDAMAHPGFITLIPVIGTCLIIRFFNINSYGYFLLTNRFAVFVGLISYSLYLWHFPIFAFSRHYFIELSTHASLLLIGLSLLLSILSYYAVEKPCRNPATVSTKAFNAYLSVGFLSLCIAFASALASNGFPSRLGNIQTVFDSAYRDANTDSKGKRCHNKAVNAHCVFNKQGKNQAIVLLGDSHADALSMQIQAMATAQDSPLSHITTTGCLHIFGTLRLDQNMAFQRLCKRQTIAAFQLLKQLPPSTIIYAGRLPLQLTGSWFDNGEGGLEIMNKTAPRLVIDPSSPLNNQSVETAILRFFERLLAKGHRVILIYPIPELGWNLKKKVQLALQPHPDIVHYNAFRQMDISTDFSVYKQRSKQAFDIYGKLAQSENLIRIYPHKAFCSEKSQRCYSHDKNSLWYYDAHHVSAAGANKIRALIEEVIH